MGIPNNLGSSFQPTPNKIILKGKYGIAKERPAGVAITPGMLIERYVASSTSKVRPHSTADGAQSRAFAREQEIIGYGIDHVYAVGDRVEYELVQPGAEVYALVPASAPAIVEGDFLGSVGDGTLKKVTIGAGTLAASVVGIALEAVDNSAGVTPARLRVEVI